MDRQRLEGIAQALANLARQKTKIERALERELKKTAAKAVARAKTDRTKDLPSL